MSDPAAKAAKWDWISAAWNTYGGGGTFFFYWDYDSRTLMDELMKDEDPADGRVLAHVDPDKPYDNRLANLRITGQEENDHA